MTLRPQTRDYIAKLSDQELFEYLCQEDYEPEAIAFAKAEFDRRKLDPQQVTTLAAAADTKAEEREKNAAEAMARPLSATAKTFAFIAGFLPGAGLPCAIIASVQFRQSGETRKSEEMWRCFFYGLGSLITLLAVLFFLPNFLRYFGW